MRLAQVETLERSMQMRTEELHLKSRKKDLAEKNLAVLESSVLEKERLVEQQNETSQRRDALTYQAKVAFPLALTHKLT